MTDLLCSLRSDQIDPKQLGGEEDLAEEVEVEAVPVEPRESGPETVRTPGAKAKELIRLLRASEEGVKSLIFSQVSSLISISLR